MKKIKAKTDPGRFAVVPYHEVVEVYDDKSELYAVLTILGPDKGNKINSLIFGILGAEYEA